jgi:YVTN family beta-propeller protein
MKRLVLAAVLLPLSVAALAAPSLKEVDRIRIGGEARWDYLTVDSAGHRLYVSHSSETEVVDTRTDKVVGVIPGTAGVHGIAIARDLGKADAVTVFDLATLKTTATIAVGANPDAILYDPATHRVMTFNGKSQDVSIIDAASAKVVATVPVGGKPEFAQMGEGGKAWFNVEDTSELATLDPATAKLLHRQSLAPCDSPSGLAVDDRFRLYSVCENKLMTVVAPDGEPLGHARIGEGSDGVAWLAGAAYSANGKDGTISVVRETSPGHLETVETFPTAAGARTIAADPATRRLYLPTAELQPAQAGARRVGVAGSFYVLVLEKTL